MTDETTTPSAAVHEHWTNKQLLLEAESIVVGRYGTSAVYALLKIIRDDMQARIDELAVALVVEQAQPAELRERIAGLYETIAGLRTECETLLRERDEAESQLAEARDDSGPNPIVEWKGWKVELDFGEEGNSQ